MISELFLKEAIINALCNLYLQCICSRLYNLCSWLVKNICICKLWCPERPDKFICFEYYFRTSSWYMYVIWRCIVDDGCDHNESWIWRFHTVKLYIKNYHIDPIFIRQAFQLCFFIFHRNLSFFIPRLQNTSPESNRANQYL